MISVPYGLQLVRDAIQLNRLFHMAKLKKKSMKALWRKHRIVVDEERAAETSKQLTQMLAGKRIESIEQRDESFRVNFDDGGMLDMTKITELPSGIVTLALMITQAWHAYSVARFKRRR